MRLARRINKPQQSGQREERGGDVNFEFVQTLRKTRQMARQNQIGPEQHINDERPVPPRQIRATAREKKHAKKDKGVEERGGEKEGIEHGGSSKKRHSGMFFVAKRRKTYPESSDTIRKNFLACSSTGFRINLLRKSYANFTWA